MKIKAKTITNFNNRKYNGDYPHDLIINTDKIISIVRDFGVEFSTPVRTVRTYDVLIVTFLTDKGNRNAVVYKGELKDLIGE